MAPLFARKELLPKASDRRASVVVASLDSGASPGAVIKDVIERAQVGKEWGSGDAIFLKPNLTYPIAMPGVTTRVEFIEVVTEYFLDKGCRVTIGEGPGGYNGFSMRDAFEAHGITSAVKRLGASLIELCLALKNLWGCVADVFRIRFHPFLDEILAELTRALPLGGAVLDGFYGLDRNGPMVEGVPRRLNWTAASRDCGAHDVTLTKLLGFDPHRISHLRYGMRLGAVPAPEGVDVTAIGIDPQQFSLTPTLWNRIAKLTWRHSSLTWLAYLSPLAGPLHWLMYLIRRKPEELTVRTFSGWESRR